MYYKCRGLTITISGISCVPAPPRNINMFPQYNNSVSSPPRNNNYLYIYQYIIIYYYYIIINIYIYYSEARKTRDSRWEACDLYHTYKQTFIYSFSFESYLWSTRPVHSWLLRAHVSQDLATPFHAKTWAESAQQTRDGLRFIVHV